MKVSKNTTMLNIKETVTSNGGQLVSYANTSLYRKINGGLSPKDLLPETQTAIVHTIRIDNLLNKYGKWYIVSLNKHLSLVNKELNKYLHSIGFKARGVAEGEYDRKTLIGKISFRQLGNLAGIGHIGKNQLLINEKLGSYFNIGVVLTNLKLSPIESSETKCTSCNLCLEVCPVGALNKKGYNRFICKNRRKILGRGCGLKCINVCPLKNKV